MTGALMEAEVRSQPSVLLAQANAYYEAAQALKGQEFDLVLLAARGSSDHAALYARYLIELVLQIPVSLAAPSVLTRYGKRVRYPKTLAIGISQSGAAPDVAEILSALRSEGHTTLAITNTADSRLTKAAEHSVLLEAGLERSVAATKTYTTSLLALYQVIRTLDPSGELSDPIKHLPNDAWLTLTENLAQDNFGVLTRTNPVLSLARGLSYCSAQETALKLMECALIPAKSYSTADFQHGPRAIAGAASSAIVFGEPIPGLAEQGCTVIEAPCPPVPEALTPIWEIFFGQWLALFAARGRGLDPDKPQHISKVTQTL
jgi:glucosamine--fructose-6-phosphate aminotransferase (isomerizing)